MKRSFVEFVHPLVMLVFFLILAFITQSFGVLLVLVGAELVTARIHQGEHHPGWFFGRDSVYWIGVVLFMIGCIYPSSYAAFGERTLRIMTMVGTQGISHAWHQYTHRGEPDFNPNWHDFAIGGTATLLSAIALTLLIRYPL